MRPWIQDYNTRSKMSNYIHCFLCVLFSLFSLYSPLYHLTPITLLLTSFCGVSLSSRIHCLSRSCFISFSAELSTLLQLVLNFASPCVLRCHETLWSESPNLELTLIATLFSGDLVAQRLWRWTFDQAGTGLIPSQNATKSPRSTHPSIPPG